MEKLNHDKRHIKGVKMESKKEIKTIYTTGENRKLNCPICNRSFVLGYKDIENRKIYCSSCNNFLQVEVKNEN